MTLSRICKEYTANINMWGEIDVCHVSARIIQGTLACGEKYVTLSRI